MKLDDTDSGTLRAAAQPPAKVSGLPLTTELPEEPAWVEADATRLVQVVENLVSNALKLTDPGGRVTLALERAAGDVAVRVRDTGFGVAELLRTLGHEADVSYDGATRGLHLIALSGYGGTGTHDRTLEAGFDHHLTKPVDPATLRVLLDVPARRAQASGAGQSS